MEIKKKTHIEYNLFIQIILSFTIFTSSFYALLHLDHKESYQDSSFYGTAGNILTN
jgi:hypothetical protein